MQPISQFKKNQIKVLFTDIDDTITDDGKLKSAAYAALWKLNQHRIKVVPVTGRPAGWCEMIARFWPVDGVIGENGGFYFRYQNGKMLRHYLVNEAEREKNRLKLQKIRTEVLRVVPGCAIASDQFCREMDLAIDFCEDVNPLPASDVQKIVEVCRSFGAQAKVSSIHVNTWFGNYDKLTMCKEFVKHEYHEDLEKNLDSYAFCGDSPNDEPMFAFFKNSFAVANIQKFVSQIKSLPNFVTVKPGGDGFCEVVEAIIR